MNKEQLLELIAELTKENMQLRKQVAQAKYETDIWMDLCCKHCPGGRVLRSKERVCVHRLRLFPERGAAAGRAGLQRTGGGVRTLLAPEYFRNK